MTQEMSSNNKKALDTVAKVKLAVTVALVVLALVVLSSSHGRCPLNMFIWKVCELPASVVIILAALVGAGGMALVSRRWHRKG